MRLAHLPPAACAACYGQDTQARHVDFEASYDGPVLDVDQPIKIPIDDLVICENCVMAAARLLGMVPASEDTAAATIAGLEQQVAAERAGRIDNLRRLQAIKGAIADEDPLADIVAPKPKTTARRRVAA